MRYCAQGLVCQRCPIHDPVFRCLRCQSALFTYSFLFARISYSSTVFTIRYDTIEEFNVDSKAEYTANLAHVRHYSTLRNVQYIIGKVKEEECSQKLKKQSQCPINSVQVKIHEGSPAVFMVPSFHLARRFCKARSGYRIAYFCPSVNHTRVFEFTFEHVKLFH